MDAAPAVTMECLAVVVEAKDGLMVVEDVKDGLSVQLLFRACEGTTAR